MINITHKYKAIEETRQALKKHIDSFWPDNSKEYLTYEEGSLKDLLPDWHVIEIAPEEAGKPWVYVTLGGWESTKDHVGEFGRYGLEFFIVSPIKDLTHVSTLAMVTLYNANPRYRVKLGDTLEIGYEWLENSSCDHFLVSLPYPFTSDLETVKINDIYVSFWWLTPITKSEAQYAQTNGSEALWKKFDELGPNFLEISRQSVV
jgi:Suppressor of fused protein (SUFU)